MNARVPPGQVLAPTPFVPPALRPDLAALMNAAAQRETVQAVMHNRTVTLRLRPPSEPAGFCVHLEWRFGNERQAAAIPAALLDALCLELPMSLKPAGGADELAAVLLECALSRALERLEAHLSQPLSLDRVGSGGDGGAAQLCLQVEHERSAFPVLLTLGPAALAALPALLGLVPQRRNDISALPVQLAVRVGVAEVSHTELLALRDGDAVLLQETGLLDGRLGVIVGEHKAAVARVVSSGIELEMPLRPVTGTPMGRWAMGTTFTDPVEDGVGALRVTLVFELGRRLASLGEVEAMGPGTVIDAGSAPDGMVDVLANGRRIGRGRIVQVGGALAVQLERVNHGASA